MGPTVSAPVLIPPLGCPAKAPSRAAGQRSPHVHRRRDGADDGDRSDQRPQFRVVSQGPAAVRRSSSGLHVRLGDDPIADAGVDRPVDNSTPGSRERRRRRARRRAAAAAGPARPRRRSRAARSRIPTRSASNRRRRSRGPEPSPGRATGLVDDPHHQFVLRRDHRRRPRGRPKPCPTPATAAHAPGKGGVMAVRMVVSPLWKALRGRSGSLRKRPLSCGFPLSGRQDLNLRPLDPQPSAAASR